MTKLSKKTITIFILFLLIPFLFAIFKIHPKGLESLTKQEVQSYVRQEMESFNPSITFFTSNDVKTWIKEDVFTQKNLGDFTYYLYDGASIHYSYYPDYTEVTIDISYKLTKSQCNQVKKKIKKIAKSCKGKNKKESIRKVNKYWKSHLSYSQKQDNIYFGIKNKKGNCYVYSTLTYLTLKQLKIPVHIVYGYAGTGSHCWNKVKVGKTWKYLDVTWNDYLNTNQYLLVSKKTLQKTHDFK